MCLCVLLIEALHVHFISTFYILNPVTFISLVPMGGRLKLCQSYGNSPSVLSTASEKANLKWRRCCSLLSLNNRLKGAWAKQRLLIRPGRSTTVCTCRDVSSLFIFSYKFIILRTGHCKLNLKNFFGFSLGTFLWLDEMEPQTCFYCFSMTCGQQSCSPEAQREEPLCMYIDPEGSEDNLCAWIAVTAE